MGSVSNRASSVHVGILPTQTAVSGWKWSFCKTPSEVKMIWYWVCIFLSGYLENWVLGSVTSEAALLSLFLIWGDVSCHGGQNSVYSFRHNHINVKLLSTVSRNRGVRMCCTVSLPELQVLDEILAVAFFFFLQASDWPARQRVVLLLVDLLI